MAAATVRDNQALSRFELDVEGAIAFGELPPQAISGDHHPYENAAPAAWARHRIGTGKGALELIRADGLKVVAGCGFVVDYLQKHPEYFHLVA